MKTTPELSRLKELAKKAKHCSEHGSTNEHIIAYAAFTNAADPQTVLELIDRIERLEMCYITSVIAHMALIKKMRGKKQRSYDY